MSPSSPYTASAVSLSALLASHDNDPHQALAALVSRYNRLASDLVVVKQEKEAAVQSAEAAARENSQLWRSLKHSGTASPRPGAQRQNSDRDLPPRSSSATGSANGDASAKGLGIDAGGASSSKSPRRALSGESPNGLPPPVPGSHFPASGSSSPRLGSGSGANEDPSIFDSSSALPSDPTLPRFPSQQFATPASPNSLRTKAATPPPHSSSRQTDPIGVSSLRKTSSLDLGRGGDGISVFEHPATPKTPPHQLQHKERRPSTSPLGAHPARSMSGSSSMPLLASSEDSLSAFLPAGSRLLPSIAPVSPLFASSTTSTASTASNSSAPPSAALSSSREGGSPRERETSFPTLPASSAAGDQLQQLQLPNGPGEPRRRERDRTVSNNSSLGSAFLDPSSGTLGEAPTLSKQDRRRSMFLPSRNGSFASSNGTLPSTPSSHSLNLAALAESSSSSSNPTRERRPSRAHQLAHHHPSSIDSEGSTSSAPATLRRAPAQLQQENQQQPPPPPPRSTLTPQLLGQTRVRVGSSNIKMNEKHKEVISFTIDVVILSPAAAAATPAASSPPQPSSEEAVVARWRVEKMYSDVLGLDAAVKSKTNRQESKSMASLPDKSLFKDHAPHKSDQRKAVLERYLQTLVSVPLRDRTAICAFFNSDVVAPPPSTVSLPPSSSAPTLKSASVTLNGAPVEGISGWLTKRGRNFGGWQTRFYVLEPGRALCYYDAPNGNKMGEIPLQAAAIGRQSSSRNAQDAGDDNAYLHAFLIRTRDDKDQEADHILCADHDDARDAWVQALTTLQPQAGRAGGSSRPKDAGSQQPPHPPTLVPPSPMDKEYPSSSTQLRDRRRSGSGPARAGGEESSRTTNSGFLSARQDLPPSVSLPSDLNALARGGSDTRKTGGSLSDGSHSIPESAEPSSSSTARPHKLQLPSSRRPSAQSGSAGTTGSIAADRPSSPARGAMANVEQQTKYSASDVSGPMNAVPLPSGYEFKKAERQKKTKSSFWGFASRDKGAALLQHVPAPPTRPVFGVPLKEAVAISRIRPGLELPAIVYRCVEYLEAKNAEHEEGIFRLSGSANVIRILKDRFNAEGDVNLLQSSEYYDPHAIAGLLKLYLRELPSHLLTRELHSEFLRVIDLRNRRDRVNALGKLVAQLPIEEYTLFRFFFAHLCLIAQNADTSKMGLRNLGIVFSPTLAIPAPLFSLLLAEFDLVFAVEKETGNAQPIMVEDDPIDPTAAGEAGERTKQSRNSQLYQATGADKLMEGELTKLREHDEAEGEGEAEETDDAQEDEAFIDAPIPSTSSVVDGEPSSVDDESPSLPPKSPGLPSSPRSPLVQPSSATT